MKEAKIISHYIRRLGWDSKQRSSEHKAELSPLEPVRYAITYYAQYAVTCYAQYAVTCYAQYAFTYYAQYAVTCYAQYAVTCAVTQVTNNSRFLRTVRFQFHCCNTALRHH
jgi:hypothetical protein